MISSIFFSIGLWVLIILVVLAIIFFAYFLIFDHEEWGVGCGLPTALVAVGLIVYVIFCIVSALTRFAGH